MSLISRADITSIFGVSKATIKSWVDYGLIEIAHYDPKTKKPFFIQKDVEALFEQGKQEKANACVCTFCKENIVTQAESKIFDVTYPLYENYCRHSKRDERVNNFCASCNRFIFKILLCQICSLKYELKNTLPSERVQREAYNKL